MSEKGLLIAAVCRALAEGADADAAAIVQRDYPFAPSPVAGRLAEAPDAENINGPRCPWAQRAGRGVIAECQRQCQIYSGIKLSDIPINVE